MVTGHSGLMHVQPSLSGLAAMALEGHKQYIQYQINRHSRTCHIGNTHKCRFSFPIPPMSKKVILEPIDFESEAEENKFKAKWRKIHKHLNQYGLGLEINVRPKLFLKCRPCEIRVNNYMKHCLEFWRENHNIQPSLSPYAMIQFMLSYVTKTKKGMSDIMDRACREARQGKWLAAQGVAAGGLGWKG